MKKRLRFLLIIFENILQPAGSKRQAAGSKRQAAGRNVNGGSRARVRESVRLL